MGHYCRLCNRERPNEKFTGKGHKIHVCKECAGMPKEKREAIENEEQIFGFLKQSNISEKNIARLRTLVNSEDARVAVLAAVALEVALVKPHKKRRLKVLAKEKPALVRKLEDTGLIYAHHW